MLCLSPAEKKGEEKRRMASVMPSEGQRKFKFVRLQLTFEIERGLRFSVKREKVELAQTLPFEMFLFLP